MNGDSPSIAVVRRLPGWDQLVTELQLRLNSQSDSARNHASLFVDEYRNRRAAMVVDAVTNRRRMYEARVKPMIAEFELRSPGANLHELSVRGSGLTGLRDREDETIRDVARGLLRFGSDLGVSGDEIIVSEWASSTQGLEIAHELDPYVGSVRGVGVATFAYLRMRCGGDSIKPDVRVRHAVRNLGLGENVPRSEVGLFVLASAVAAELGIPRLVLDQLLWFIPSGGDHISR